MLTLALSKNKVIVCTVFRGYIKSESVIDMRCFTVCVICLNIHLHLFQFLMLLFHCVQWVYCFYCMNQNTKQTSLNNFTKVVIIFFILIKLEDLLPLYCIHKQNKTLLMSKYYFSCFNRIHYTSFCIALWDMIFVTVCSGLMWNNLINVVGRPGILCL